MSIVYVTAIASVCRLQRSGIHQLRLLVHQVQMQEQPGDCHQTSCSEMCCAVMLIVVAMTALPVSLYASTCSS